MPVRRHKFTPARPTAEAFWDAVAAALDGERVPLRVFVPDAAHVESCRNALWRRQAHAGRSWRAPLVGSLLEVAERTFPRHVRAEPNRWLQLADALARLKSIRGPDRIALAVRLTASLDRLDLAAVAGGGEDAVAPSALPADGDHDTPVLDELRMLRALRNALGTESDPVPALLASCLALADGCERDVVVHWQPLEPIERAFIERAGQRGTVHVIELDAAAAAFAAPMLAAAWPDAFGLPAGDLRMRAHAAAQQVAPLVLHAASREDEAQAAAQWICMQLAAGRHEVRVVALDDWVARRLHALLMRADVRMSDSVGMPLSRSLPAAAIMRWLDLVIGDAPQAQLSAWLASPFVLADRDARSLLDWIEAAAARGRWLGGWQALLAARGIDDAWQRLLDALAGLAARQRVAQSASGHAATMRTALAQAGVWQALAADATGRQAADAFERLCTAVAVSDAMLTVAEWRDLLAHEFDRLSAIDRAVDSPVRRVPLDAVVAAPCEALIVVGANREALAAASQPELPTTDSLNARLGLPTRRQQADRTLRQFALALALAPHAALTCRDDAARGIERSAWVERLVAVRGGQITVEARTVAHIQRVPVRVTPLRGARATGQGLLPERLAVTDIEQLAVCPYRFWAQALLGLREPREPIDMPQRRELGSFVHAVLFDFHRQLSAQRFEAAAARALLDAVTDRHAEQQAAAGFLPLLAEWRATVPRYIDWLAQRGTHAWRWQDGELPLDARFQVGDMQVVVRGRVDRIDAAVRDGQPVHAVIDYKVGAASSHRRRAGEPDEFAQLPLYLLLLEQAGLEPIEAGFLAIERDRIELVPLSRTPRGRQSAQPVEPRELAARWRERVRHTLVRIERAEPLQAIGHSGDCASCTVQGLCRKQHWWQDQSS